tara:strand:+ start:55 stop:540 length:486 start_codon:yes stop_codon:yes gene_type:complete
MNNLFYKSLATISTLGIIVLSATQLLNVNNKTNNSEIEISKTLIELKKARKEALDEVKTFKSDILKELKAIKSETISEFKTAEKEAIKTLEKKSGGSNEKIWLVLRVGGYNSGGWSNMPVALEKISMPSMEECQLQGALFAASKNIANRDYLTGFECLEGN